MCWYVGWYFLLLLGFGVLLFMISNLVFSLIYSSLKLFIFVMCDMCKCKGLTGVSDMCCVMSEPRIFLEVWSQMISLPGLAKNPVSR